MDMLISVIVPIYNVDKYLKECIDSILNQSYTNFEVWLVDDGSTDGSLKICEDYAKLDSRINVIHKENGGLSSARNVGLDNATGEYIAFIDSDDSINSEYLNELYTLCEKEKCDIAQCDFLYISDESMKLNAQANANTRVISGKEAVEKCCDSIVGVKFNVAWNKLYKRSLFIDIRYPEGKIHEDEFTTYKVFNNACKVAITDKYLYWYLQRSDSIMGKKFETKRLVRLEAYKERLKFLKEQGFNNTYFKFLITYYHSLWGYYQNVKDNIIGCEYILVELEKEANKLTDEILSIPGRSFLDNLRVVYRHLPNEEKDKYKNIYGDGVGYGHKEEFVFPYNKVALGARIALYGGGNVGKAYFQQLITMRYAKVTLWVDNKWNSISKEGIEIEPIDSLIKKQHEFDYVVLAIRNLDMAMEIRQNLIDWGLDSDKIIWQSPVMISVPEASQIQKEIIKISKIPKDSISPRIILMNSPEHGNLGDHALAIAARAFFKKNFPTYEVLEFSGKQWDYCNKEILEIIKPKDVICFVGGGYMGDIWQKESLRVKGIMKSCSQNIKIFLPQTFYYSSVVSEEERVWFNNDKKTLYIHREKNSRDTFVESVVTDLNKNLLYPDMVMSLEYKKKNDREGALLCFRGDKECAISNHINEKIKSMLSNINICYNEIDTVIPRNVTMDFRQDELEKLLAQISGSKLLVTDRLHGMLFALITHTPCIAFDNITHKVQGVFEWIKDIPYIKCVKVEEFNIEILKEMICVDCETTQYEYQSLFKAMADEIHDWINRNHKEEENI